MPLDDIAATTIAEAKRLLPAKIQVGRDIMDIPQFVAADVALLAALICVGHQRGLSDHTSVKDAVGDICGSEEWLVAEAQLARFS